MPLRRPNDILLSAGHAPAYGETPPDRPSMRAVGAAPIQFLDGHVPFPALVVDGRWDVVDANLAVDSLVSGCAAESLEPPVNVLRLSLHPRGLAPRITNLPQWRERPLPRLDHRIRVTGDAELGRPRAELAGYPGGTDRTPRYELAVPLRADSGAGVLSFFSTTTVFGTPMDVTVSDLAIESFFPADAETAELFNG